MKHLRWLAVFAALALVHDPLPGQQATITINGTAYGTIAGIGHNCPMREQGGGYRMDGYVGMQVSCPIWAIAADSSFTPSSISVTVSDESRISAVVVHSVMDTLGVYSPDTLKIQVLRQGNWHLDVTANPILFIMGYGFNRAPDAAWPQYEYPPMINVLEDEVFALCAYQGGYGTDATAKSINDPPCPDLGGTPLPEFEVNWILPDILAPWNPAAVPATRMALLNDHPELLNVVLPRKDFHAVQFVTMQ